ncbi:MAG TPA: type 1 glutamine amidotransferase domain-containing protein [Chloroflexota bacterium]|jgi:protease I|nr:type 1 glutamine amidotransferase domain-containing protein [Chloroflexota bacterium]
MNQQLNGKRIAILATDGVEQVELLKPQQALKDAGAHTEVISPKQGQIQGWNHDQHGDRIPVDRVLDQANPSDYDALVLPGGVMNPDQLRTIPAAVAFVKSFFDANKPVAAICHGPWMIVEADAARGRHLTSWPSLRTDIRNAGGQWDDQQVIVDRNLVTSRKPDDIPAFNQQMIEKFGAATPVGGGTR